MLINTYIITRFYYMLNMKNNEYPGIKNKEVSQRFAVFRTLKDGVINSHLILSLQYPWQPFQSQKNLQVNTRFYSKLNI